MKQTLALRLFRPLGSWTGIWEQMTNKQNMLSKDLDFNIRQWLSWPLEFWDYLSDSFTGPASFAFNELIMFGHCSASSVGCGSVWVPSNHHHQVPCRWSVLDLHLGTLRREPFCVGTIFGWTRVWLGNLFFLHLLTITLNYLLQIRGQMTKILNLLGPHVLFSATMTRLWFSEEECLLSSKVGTAPWESGEPVEGCEVS